MLSQHLYNLQCSLFLLLRQRITVPRPSKVDGNNFSAAGNNVGRGTKKKTFVGHLNGLEKSHLGGSPAASWKIDDNPTQPTRILLLKPSPGKPHNVKAVGSRLPKSPMRLHEDFFGDFKDDENQESRKVAKAIKWQMRENLGGHQRDETLLSSVYSNGYISDEKSLNRSEIDYAASNLSDSEVMSPVSRQSWDYVDGFDSLERPRTINSIQEDKHSTINQVTQNENKTVKEHKICFGLSPRGSVTKSNTYILC
ncbi:Protein of unknown function (DUF3741) [Abeliophyllum distichum]|uniref:Uncharacterized protein n=1 Tax=Abeliophyllum distichum TaxID=126358 RepID=A0ABD1RCF5_9LAMI